MKNKLPYILLLIFALVGLFYWFQIRPNSIRKRCIAELAEKFRGQATIQKGTSDALYRICLVKNGMKPESLGF